MQKQGYRPSTITATIQTLKSIARKAHLLNPNSTKAYIASANLSESRKSKLAEDLARFYICKHTPFDKPRYKRIERLPFIPLEVEVDQLIAGTSRKTSAFLQLLKETGMRPGEAWNLKWTDIDLERSTVNISPEKGSNPRQLRITTHLIAMLNNLPHPWLYVFRNPKVDRESSMKTFQKGYEKRRRFIAEKLQNPRIQQITFKTLRHFKATLEYHKTRDILHVMQLLGHKSIKNTLVYTHLVNLETDEWVCKVATTKQERVNLIESGFTFVAKEGDQWYFRKRK